jgi:hypothetical protein
MRNEGPDGSKSPRIGVGDIVCVDTASSRMLVVDLGSDGDIVTVSWKDAKGIVFEIKLQSAKLTVLRRVGIQK